MRSRLAKLSQPLNISVSKIASFFPEFRYRGPFKSIHGEIISSEYILNSSSVDKMGVLLFKDKTKNGFTTITSEYTPRELASLFTSLPEELVQPLTVALKGTDLEIPKLSAQELAYFKREREEEQRKDEAFKKLQTPLQGTKEIDFKPNQSVAVLQHEYALTTSNSNKPVLGTFGAANCLILALYDSSSKTAILAHIDALTDIYSLNMLFNKISKKHTVAHLAGGDLSSKSMCMSIIEMLQSNNIKIATSDIVRPGFLSGSDTASLAIDTRTGTIYSPVLYHQLEETDDLNIRFQTANLQSTISPLHECYNSQNPSKAHKQSASPYLSLNMLASAAKEAKTPTILKEGQLYQSFNTMLGKSFL